MSGRRIFTVVYLVGLLLGLLASALRPVSFQKINAIREVETPIPAIAAGPAFDAQGVLSAIPAKPDSHEGYMVWAVDPDEKYRATIVEGRGNCSNKVFGLARHLETHDVDFQIIHLMLPRNFLSGKGHTALRTRYELGGTQHVGIVDVFAGGLPRTEQRLVDVADLQSGALPEFEFVSYGGEPVLARRYYERFLDEVEIGWISADEVARYFAFVQSVDLPVEGRVRKYAYDGLAVLLGFYPTIYVNDLTALMASNPIEWRAFRVVAWLFRSSLVVIPLLAWLEWRDWRRRRSPAAS